MPEKLQLDLQHLTEADVVQLAQSIASLGEDAAYRQVVATRLVDHIYNVFQTPDSDLPACVLVRCFQTSAYARLPLHYRFAADELLEQIPSHDNMRCLALLATRGSRTVWSDVATSVAHQCIPLPSVEVVQKAPMIARLIQQFGLSIEDVVSPAELPPPPTDLLLDQAPPAFNVFHIPQAPGSPYIPAQESFVLPHGVRSVLGMGGLLPDGEVFAVVLFTRVPIARSVANLFRTLAATVRSTLVPFKPAQVFLDREF